MKQIIACLLLLVFAASAAHAERRVALVIGNSGYANVAELKNPYNDAKGMSDKLTDLGFDVVTGLDLSLRDMRQTVREFIKKLDNADLALFFYAGHGIQVNGENYLVPVDAELSTHLDLDFEALPANLVLNAMEQSTKVNLVFLDACRNNPFTENLARSMGTRSSAVGRGLAKIGSGVGSLVSFATQPGNVALDGDGENSPFTTALIKHLGTPGQDITRDLVMVRRDVLEATKGQQVPWDNSSLTGEVILKQLEMVQPVEPEKPAINPQIELAYWDSIKSGESIAYFETYLTRYPEGQFADIAKIRIDELKSRSEAEAARNAKPDTSAEIAFWQSIQNATRPEMYETYLEQYPDGIYAKLARLNISSLQQQAEAAATAAAAAQAAKAADASNSTPPVQEITVSALPQQETVSTAPASSVTPSTSSRSLSPEELATAMQTELNRLGCSVGRVDGDWGNRSRQALRIFSREAGVDLASLDPDPSILDRLKQSTGRVCPLTCGRNQELKNGKCIAVRQEAPSKSNEKSNSTKTVQSSGACPANPTASSRRLVHFNNRQITATITHPCGRQVTCNRNLKSGTQPTCFWR
ncbi:Caspase domain protein [Labrenzia sp. THAF191b]|uniref:caspase family protein n=1 Tax=unclassified Labrenzia TaxID=2648686 RepID=UPI0012686469|nr:MULTISPECIES: caspase family protein [unclassified Labrenzia]QFS99426.1 Caspase domain protein [Labrenzia sp. THAF191b]QFT05740.1 Caspase domain protein [Labrenzia sp. THAF191a]QFT17284.1 Caspase domain protein [Labrenzia sp. THAF187b]